MKQANKLLKILFLIGLLQPVTTGLADDKILIGDYLDIITLFNAVGYTEEAWHKGVRKIPRLNISRIPKRWGQQTVHEISVRQKKKIFFRVILPIVLRVNEEIVADRRKLSVLIATRSTGKQPSSSDRRWLADLAVRYKVLKTASDTLDNQQQDMLARRVDIIPSSLALGMAAYESGWGTSRFTAKANALFGQRTWGGGTRPKKARPALGDDGLADLNSPLNSVKAYALNLNTHRAYRSFRRQRAMMRRKNKPLSGLDLASTMTNYSELGQKYVKTLQAIIRKNHLIAADKAYLSNEKVLHLIPVQRSSKP